MMPSYHLDFETYSEADLGKYGAFRYSQDDSTEILLCAIAREDEEPVLWSKTQTLAENTPALNLMREIVSDPDNVIYAHNAQFETAIIKYNWKGTFELKAPELDQWRCTAAMARRAAIPSSLADCGAFLGIRQEKDTEGKRLIEKFSMPIKKGKRKGERILPQDDPEDFKRFGEYCLQDVRAEREIHKRLHKFEFKDSVLDSFIFDLHMNHRGVPVNVDALRFTDSIVEELNDRLTSKFRAITGLNPSQRQMFLEWAQKRGYLSKNLQAPTVESVLSTEGIEMMLDGDALEALKIYQLVGFAALKKIPTMVNAANSDGRVRGALMWSGAERTHRWAGRIIQPQNFKRPEIKDTGTLYDLLCSGKATSKLLEVFYDNPLLAIASCIRHFIQPKPWVEVGCDESIESGPGQFLDADYAAIEARVVLWLCGQEDGLELFRQGKDPYIAMASKIFGVPVDEVTKDQRFVGKQSVLGCGFGMGDEKFMGTCESYGQKISQELAKRAIKTFRSVNHKVTSAWRSIDNAAKEAILNPGNKVKGTDKITFVYSKGAGFPALIMRLPSGHCLLYPRARIVKAEKKFKGEKYMTDEIQFWGKQPVTGKWGWVGTYGGKLLENATQAVAGDIMANGALNADKAGYEICMLVHDQALAEWKPGQSTDEFCELLCDLPEWAEGLPVAAEGDLAPYYLKG